MAWMRIYDRHPAQAANATATTTMGDEGLSRLLRDAFYQFAADGEPFVCMHTPAVLLWSNL